MSVMDNTEPARAVEKGLSQRLLCKLVVMSIPYFSYVKLLKNKTYRAVSTFKSKHD